MAERQTVTWSEAAELIGVHMSTVARLVRRGELEGYKLTCARNSLLRVYRDTVDKLLERRQRPN
jgi:excisionase family DNA binding protein